jgi:hypothetical protein
MSKTMPTESAPAPAIESRFAKYADGKRYLWVKGQDYDCKTETLRHYAYRWAWRHGFHPKVAMRGETVTIQFLRERD